MVAGAFLDGDLIDLSSNCRFAKPTKVGKAFAPGPVGMILSEAMQADIADLVENLRSCEKSLRRTHPFGSPELSLIASLGLQPRIAQQVVRAIGKVTANTARTGW